MNIYIFCGTAAFGKGGMEKIAINLASKKSESHNVTLGYFSKDDKEEPSYCVSEKVVKAPWDREKESMMNYAIRIAEAMPDVFIYFGATCQIMQIISLLKGIKVPLIVHEGSNPNRVLTNNWSLPRKISRYEAAWERQLIYSEANAIRFTMDEYKYSLPASFNKKIFCFPNAFEPPHLSYRIIKEKKIINIGGLKKNKNISPLLEACKNVFKQHPEWRLEIYSALPEGNAAPYADELKETIGKIGIEDNVILKGVTDDIYAEYIKSSFHVITSLSEGLSNAVAEAMCCGIPSIGIKNVPGVDGLIVDGKNGFLVEHDHLVKNLENKISQLIVNKEMCENMGREARKDASIFSPNDIYYKWDKMIEYAITNRHNNCEIHKHCARERERFYSKNTRDYAKIVTEQKYFINTIQSFDTDIFINEQEETLKNNGFGRW